MFKFKKEQARNNLRRLERIPILPNQARGRLHRQETRNSLELDPFKDEREPVDRGGPDEGGEEAEELNGRICRIMNMYASPQCEDIANGVKLMPLRSFGYLNALINQNCHFISED